MIRRICLAALIAVLPHPVHAGHGTIRETDTQIIIEYTGDDYEVKAGKMEKEQEEKKKEAEEEKERKDEDKYASQRAKHEARIRAREAAGRDDE